MAQSCSVRECPMLWPVTVCFSALVGTLSESTRVPVLAIVVQAVWASILAMSGPDDQLTDYVVFATWLFVW